MATHYVGTQRALSITTKVADTKIKLNNGLNMPVIGFGTYTIKGKSLIKEVLDHALAAGYRSIDTAAVYGNEDAIGEALKTLLPKYHLSREDIFITTKLAPKDQGSNHVLKAANESLKLLGVDYVDLYLIHWPGSAKVAMGSEENKALRFESWTGLEELYKSGKLKSIGVSNYTHQHMSELLDKCTIVPMVNQVEFHPHFRQNPQLESICAKNHILLQAYSSLGGNGNSKLLQDQTVVKVASSLRKSPAQILLRWALQKGYAIVPKSVTATRIGQNIDLDFIIDEPNMKLLNNIPSTEKYSWDPTHVV